MVIELLDDNKLEIVMKSYIQEAINLFAKDVSTKVSSQVNKNLHAVNPYPPTLPKKQAEYFHFIVAMLLW